MHLTNGIKQAGATGYILPWLLGIPIPILFDNLSRPRLHIKRFRNEGATVCEKSRPLWRKISRLGNSDWVLNELIAYVLPQVGPWGAALQCSQP